MVAYDAAAIYRGKIEGNRAVSQTEFESLAAEAVRCRVCFERLELQPAMIDIAQPRWVGPEYWNSKPRVAIVMLNPGSGTFRSDGADEDFRSLLHQYANGAVSLDAVMEHQSRDMENWGRGRFAGFFLNGAGFAKDDIALVNIAWCATAENLYPDRMLETCCTRYTIQLVGILSPDLVILSGNKTSEFEKTLQDVIPNARFHRTLHYAHRKGKAAEADALSDLRDAVMCSIRSTGEASTSIRPRRR